MHHPALDAFDLCVMCEHVHPSVTPAKKGAQHPTDKAHDYGTPECAAEPIDGKTRYERGHPPEEQRVDDENEETQREQDERRAEQKQNRPDERVENPEQQRRADRGARVVDRDPRNEPGCDQNCHSCDYPPKYKVPHGSTVGGKSRWTQTVCENQVANRIRSVDGFATKFTRPVPKKTKNKPAIPPTSTKADTASTGLSTRPARKRTAPKSASKNAAFKKKTPTAAAGKSKSQEPNKFEAAAEPSHADIRTRAYFIAERRMQLAIPGDSAHDWLEAKRQLMEEASRSHA